MGMFKRLAEEASEKVLDFFRDLNKKKGVYMNVEQMEDEVGDKARKLAMEAPEIFGYYEDIPLFKALQDANEKGEDLAVMNPKTFRRLAARLRTDIPEQITEVGDKVEDYRSMFQRGMKFDAIPRLKYELRTSDPEVMQIIDHDGRHRNRALESLGKKKSLVRMYSNENLSDYSNLRFAPKETDVYSEDDRFYKGLSPPVGSLGDLMKILGISGAVAPGALSSLGGEDGS
tara:strand:- start:4133 stop:4822 length:690 start_codon:yes stop_codon:yes gene_type:complete